MAILERLSDPYGSVILGWIHPNVFYARFEQTISADVGARFARRFTALIGDAVGAHYFSDSSAASSYDLVAYARIVDAMREKCDHFKLMVLLPWSASLGARARALPQLFDCLEYVTTDAEFQARLRAAAPGADPHAFTTLVESGTGASFDATGATDLYDEAAAALQAAETRASGGSLTYVFDLSDFERGRFTATRFEQLSSRPGGAWVCVAGSDQQALELARQAALVEWSAPRTRERDAFTVRFVDAQSASTFDRRH